MQSDIKIIEDEQRFRPPNSEVFRLRGDNTSIFKLTNWKPEYSIKEGLKETINWFKNPKHLAKYKHEVFNY